MSIIKGEGTHTILYGTADIHNGLSSSRGYLARPDHAGSFPTLLVSHDWAGITSSIKSFARSFARHGYAVVVPDYYRGQGSNTPWPAERLAGDLDGASRFMSSPDTPWVGSIAVVGFGSGAPAATDYVLEHPSVRALVLVSPLTTFGLGQVGIPTMGIYGKNDELVGDWSDAQDRAPQVEWLLYANSGHDLLDEGAESYDAAVAEDALLRIRKFLDSHLGAETPNLSPSR